MNQNRNNDKQPSPDDYLRQDVYDSAGNGYIALTLVVALILNFLPLPDNAAIASAEVIASGLFDPARMKSRPLGRDQ